MTGTTLPNNLFHDQDYLYVDITEHGLRIGFRNFSRFFMQTHLRPDGRGG